MFVIFFISSFSTLAIAQSESHAGQERFSAKAGASPEAASADSYRVNTDEVSLDLVVRTKGGKPVLNLKPDDLVITDDGKPVTLAGFHLVQGTDTEHLVTILFDRLNPGPAKTAREIAAKLLKIIPDQGYTYAVLQMNGRLQLLQSWTSSREVVDRAIAAATTQPAAVPTDLSPAEKELIAAAQDDSLSVGLADRERAKQLLTGLEESQRLLEDNHTYSYPSLAALTALANSQRQITGRKMIVWFAEGFTADSHARDAVKALVGQANRDGVTLVVVDTLALNQQIGDKMMGAMAMAGQSPGGSMAAADALGTHGYGRGESGAPIGQVMDAAHNMSALEFSGVDDTKSPLNRLATETGGVYMQAGANLKDPLRLLHEDLTRYYQASYVPGIKDYNGAFRPIVVHPLRKGIVVSTRAGYFAVPPDTGTGIRPFEVPLLNLLASPHPPTDVSFRTSILHLGKLSDGNTAALIVQIPVSQLEVREDANTHLSQVHATIVAQIKNAKGTVVQRFSEDVPLHETPDMLRNDPGQVITMQRHFSGQPGAYTLETAVMDRQATRAGAQRTSFNLAPIPAGPALSDIALVHSVEPMQAETATFEPMRYQDGRVVPDLSADLPENTKSLSLFFLVHPLPGTTVQPTLEMQIFRNHELLGKMPLELRKVSGTGGVIPYLGNIQSRVFPPGDYEVKAVLTQNGETATSSTSFNVQGTIAASSAPMSSFTAGTGEAETAAQHAADQHLTSTAAVANSQFVIATPANAVPAPTADQIHTIVESARQRALAWSETLPNFFCIEVTDHSIDPDARGDWHHKDTMVQLMRYADHQESRTTIELNGQKSHVQAADLDFAHSVGEFGGMFQLVFDPSAKAQFDWKESDVLDGQPVQVFAFRVAQKNSNFDLTGLNNRQHAVGFHGLLYLDAATRSVRRITLSADDIPENLQVRATTISVDYSWVSINNHDYLMPARGAISLREGKHQVVLNEFEFRDYRRFGSQIRILTNAESKTLSKE